MIKRILYFTFFLVLISFLEVFNSNVLSALEKLPSDFKSQCYEFYTKLSIEKSSEIYQVISNKPEIIFTQSWYLLPNKLIKTEIGFYNYSLNIINDVLKKNNSWAVLPEKNLSSSLTSSWKIDEELIYQQKLEEVINETYNKLKDDDEKTFIDYKMGSKTWEIIVNLDEKLKVGEFKFNFKYFSEFFFTSYSISDDWETYSKINRNEINSNSFKNLKIELISSERIPVAEDIKIFELYFSKNNNYYLVESINGDDIEMYSKYVCDGDDKLLQWKNYNNNLNNNENLKVLNIILDKNPKFTQYWVPFDVRVYNKLDIDNDWIEDDLDNCKYVYNPRQLDSNQDGKWDLCMDDDLDEIIWVYDNCPNVSNKDQEDENYNNVWDVCEIDTDEDWILDWLDNCINKKNTEQFDDDNDNVWNLCDNCNYYNPWQVDIDKNSVWDICDYIKSELLKIDSDLDWILNTDDNCVLVSNKDQEDVDDDDYWDVCDNCKNIKNRKQIDVNSNNVWDMCEDSDWDTIIWYLDNCINIPNINQEDIDGNGIWDFCEDKDYDKIVFINDNCPDDFNPNQEDIDNDLIWDVCDNLNVKFIKSNKWLFIWVFMFIWFLLWWWVWLIIRKIRK